MGFNLQGFGPFLHWLTLGVLIVLPISGGVCDLHTGQSSRENRQIARPPASGGGQHLRLDGHHHVGALAARDGVGLLVLRASRQGELSDDVVDRLLAGVRAASQRIAAIEASFLCRPPRAGA